MPLSAVDGVDRSFIVRRHTVGQRGNTGTKMVQTDCGQLIQGCAMYYKVRAQKFTLNKCWKLRLPSSNQMHPRNGVDFLTKGLPCLCLPILRTWHRCSRWLKVSKFIKRRRPKTRRLISRIMNGAKTWHAYHPDSTLWYQLETLRLNQRSSRAFYASSLRSSPRQSLLSLWLCRSLSSLEGGQNLHCSVQQQNSIPASNSIFKLESAFL
jgi:hypothetical protein